MAGEPKRSQAARLGRAVFLAMLATPCFLGGSPQQATSAGTLTGIVRDELGRPTEGVVVSAVLETEVASVLSEPFWAEQHEPRSAETDANGRYRISGLAPASYLAVVTVSHWTIPNERLGGCIEPATWVADDFEFVDPVRIWPTNGLVDRTRRFLQPLPAGLTPPPLDSSSRRVYRTTFSPSATSAAEAALVAVAPGATASADILMQLVRSVRVAGRVIGDRGQKLLTLTGPTGRATTMSDRDGAFVFMDAPLGTYRLSAVPDLFSCDVRVPASPRWTSDSDWRIAADIDDVEVRLARPRNDAGTARVVVPARRTAMRSAESTAASVTGRVRSLSGQGVPRARLELREPRGAVATAISDEEGHYRFDDVEPGDYLLAVSKDGWEETLYGQTRRLGEGTSIHLIPSARFEADIILQRHGSLSGTVVDDQGRPVRQVLVWAPFAGTRTDNLGRYELKGALEGTWPVVAVANDQPGLSLDPYAPDSLPGTVRQIDIVGGTTAKGIDFKLASTQAGGPNAASLPRPPALDATLTTRFVLEGAGAPPGYTNIGVMPVNRETPWRSLSSFDQRLTNATPVSAGRYIVRATTVPEPWLAKSAMVDGVDAFDEPFEVAGGDPKEIVVTLTTRSSRVAGTVVSSDRTPMSRVTLIVFSADARHWNGRSRRIRVVRPRTDGYYEVNGLPAGSYKVTAVVGLAGGERADDNFLRNINDAAEAVVIEEGAAVTRNVPVRPRATAPER